MTVLLVRHASAGERSVWQGDDSLRPLDGRGREQAEGLVSSLEDAYVRRILSSPAVRCAQTVEPLAAARGVEVEPRAELAEGSSRPAVLELLAEVGDDIVLCTHGDVVAEILGREGPKGAVWQLDVSGRLIRG